MFTRTLARARDLVRPILASTALAFSFTSPTLAETIQASFNEAHDKFLPIDASGVFWAKLGE